jgi:hypothetical protein
LAVEIVIIIKQTNLGSILLTVKANYYLKHRLEVKVMVFNASLNNISAISCRSVLLVEETGVTGENH